MKLQAKTLALAVAVSAVFWNTVSSIFFTLLPTSFLHTILSQVPMHVVSVMILNGIITFASLFLVVFTAAYLYNRWGR